MAYAKPESSLAQNDGAMQSNIQNRRATSGVRDARHPSLVRSWDGAFQQSNGRGFGMGWRSPLVTRRCIRGFKVWRFNGRGPHNFTETQTTAVFHICGEKVLFYKMDALM
jgi:hypothetical protein